MAEQVYVFPTSFAQQRLWFLDQLVPGSAFYNIDVAIPFSQRLDAVVFEASVNEIVRRHEVLRTTFKAVNGEPFQVIAATSHIPLRFADLRPLPDAERDARATELATEQARKPFDLAKGPLIRTTLVQMGEEEFNFLLTLHHIVCDGWSLGVFFDELTSIYESFATGEPSPLPQLAVQYADFAVSQKRWLDGPEAETHLNYWKKQLTDLPVLRLPVDRPRPAVPTYAGARHTFAIPMDLHGALRDLSQREKVTMFMTLLTAFAVLLYRYTGQEDIVVGTPVANRNHAAIEDLIGFFVNPIVIRVGVSGSAGFRETLLRVRNAALEAYDHQDLPFERIVHELHPERNLTGNALFQVTFQLFSPVEAPALEKNSGEEDAFLGKPPLQIEKGTANIDLALDMWEVPEGVWGVIEYSTEQFDASTINQIAEHFLNLLAEIAAEPDRILSEFSLLSDAERHRVVVEWNQTAAPFPRGACLHRLFEEQVERTPGNIAVTFRNEHLSYGELNRRADRVAGFLRTAGVGPDTIVAIYVEPSVDLIAGLLGILKAGGAYLPLDPLHPKQRLAFFLEDAKPPVLLTQERLLAALPSFSGRTLCLDADRDLIANSPDLDSRTDVTSQNLCYVIYTSGSSGIPKGVLVGHRQVCNHLLWMQTAFPLTEADRVPQKYSFSFDASVCEIFGPLIAGSQLIIAERGEHVDISELVTLFIEHQVTVLDLVPSLLQVLLDDQRFVTCGSIRRVICGGEPLSSHLQQRFFERMDAELINAYGPTEATIGATAWICRRGDTRSPVPIGRPIANISIFVLDKHLNPVPIGAAGELHIGGEGVARGYLNQPALTAEKFIPNPFATDSADRLYKSGDMARYLPDGNIEYLGRIDQQVKIRGYRIELGEIEAALQRHASVRTCAVSLREDESGQARLVAYVAPENSKPEIWPSLGEYSVSENGRAYAAAAGLQSPDGVNGTHGGPSEISEPEKPIPIRTAASLSPVLRNFLRETLPEHMVPAAFVLMEELPLTSAGKIDRGALPHPFTAKPDGLESEPTRPTNEVESVLLSVWTQVLGVDRIGIHDNFFELGGDSILSIRVVARAAQAGLHFTPAQLFQHQTIAELAAVAEALHSVRTDQESGSGRVALTATQRWFFEQDLPDPHHYNQSILFEVPRSLEAGKTATVLDHLLSHHDALRLRFRRDESGWQQTMDEVAGPISFSTYDLSGLAEAGQKAEIERIGRELQASLNLSDAPLLRAGLFDLGRGRTSRLLLAVHHLVIDGVSWRILLEDFETAYAQLAAGEEIVLPAKTTSFQHWAERLSQYAQSAAVEQEAGYWLELAKAEAEPLPRDMDGENTVASAASVVVTLNAVQTRELLQEVPKAYRTQINDVLLTALVQAFERWTGKRSLLLDLEGHGREGFFGEVDVSRTVGWFTAIFPVNVELGERTEAGEVLKGVKEQLRRIPHGGVGYGLLRYVRGEAEAEEKLRALPRPEVAFNYLGQFGQEKSEGGAWKTAEEPIGVSASPRGLRPYLIEINGSVDEGRLQLDWSYSAEIHQRSTIERLASGFLEALESLISHCRSAKSRSYTPSDFSKAKLSQRDLDRLLSKLVPDSDP